MKAVVQKFGGTSVATPEGRALVAEKIRGARERGLNPVVVLSAMGRAPQPYATDSLLSLIADYPADAAEVDMLMSCGEIISCVVMSHHLRSLGIRAAALDARRARIYCSAQPGDAKVVSIDPAPMLALMSAGIVPVVTGFQGLDPEGMVATLGRGGSDTTAVAVGAALKAYFVEIYTDVEGVMTADPRVYQQAEILSQINFEEMGELAQEGAKVVHPRAVELADENGLPLWIKSTFSDAYGTYLSRAVPKDAFERSRVVTGIAHTHQLLQLVVEVSENPKRLALLQKLAAAGLSLDLVNLTEYKIFCIVKQSGFSEEIRAILDQSGYRYKTREGCSKISVVGAGMRGTPGVMAAVLDCLVRAGVEVIHSTDSAITISCLIPSEQVPAAVGELHRHFIAF